MRPLRRAHHPNVAIPGRIRGIGFDLDPDRHTGLSDGAAVASAPDFSGYGRDCEQSTASFRPTWEAAERNGRAVYRFDGSDNFLTGNAAALGLFRNLAGCTVTLVYTAATTGSTEVVFWVNTAAASARLAVVHEQTGAGVLRFGGRRTDADAFAQVDVAGGVVNGAWVINTGVFDYANTDLTVYQNGAQIGINTSFQTAGNLADSDSSLVSVGGAGASFAQMDLRRLLVHTRALGRVELVKLHRALGRDAAIGVA